MKTLLAIVLGLSTVSALAARTYSEEEFVKKVNEEVKKKVDSIKINQFLTSQKNFSIKKRN